MTSDLRTFLERAKERRKAQTRHRSQRPVLRVWNMLNSSQTRTLKELQKELKDIDEYEIRDALDFLHSCGEVWEPEINHWKIVSK